MVRRPFEGAYSAPSTRSHDEAILAQARGARSGSTQENSVMHARRELEGKALSLPRRSQRTGERTICVRIPKGDAL